MAFVSSPLSSVHGTSSFLRPGTSLRPRHYLCTKPFARHAAIKSMCSASGENNAQNHFSSDLDIGTNPNTNSKPDFSTDTTTAAAVATTTTSTSTSTSSSSSSAANFNSNSNDLSLSTNEELTELFDTDLDLNLRNIPSPGINDDDRKKVGDITAKGKDQLDQVADEVRGDIQELRKSSEALADELIQQEIQTLLGKYQDHQSHLLESVKSDRAVIEEEMNKVQQLADSSNDTFKLKKSGVSSKTKVLQATTLLFGLGALVFAFNALGNSDSSAMTNSLVDAAVAVCSAYVLSKQKDE